MFPKILYSFLLLFLLIAIYSVLQYLLITKPHLTSRHDSVSSLVEPEPLFKDPSNKYYCLSGQDPSKLSPKEQLAKFIEGPCSPMILVPGMMGTSLIVNIDCEKLKSKNPEIFSACGWETCSSWEFWLSKPKNEYKLWLTDLLSPLSIFSMLESSHSCFSSLIKINFNASATTDEERYASPMGVNVTWFGNSESTKESSHCGLSAVRDITGIIHYGCDSEGFGKFVESFENLGYQNSMTLQAIPYDFRKGVMFNDFERILKRSLKFMHDLTGKKVTIIGHSLGNNYVLHALNNMKQEDKDQQIFEYVLIGAPLMGTLNALQAEISGFKEFQFYNSFGLVFDAQKTFLSSPSLFESLPFDTFERFRNTEWMQDILARMEQEKIHQLNTSEGNKFWLEGEYNLKWFPNPLELCSNNLEKTRNCSPDFIDFSVSPLVRIGNQSFYGSKEDLLQLVEKYFATKGNPLAIYTETLKNNLHLLENPEVSMTIIYSSLMNTTKQLSYKSDPKEQTVKKQDFFWDEETGFGRGDGNILASSVLVPASKWIWEHQNKIKGAKPTKVVEMCSNYENMFSDNLDELSFYSGGGCSCLETENINNCKHSCMISDDSVIRVVFDAVRKHPKVWGRILPEKINYQLLEKECFQLELNLEVEDVINFLINK